MPQSTNPSMQPNPAQASTPQAVPPSPRPAQLRLTRRVLTLLTLFALLVALGIGLLLGALPFLQGFNLTAWWQALQPRLWTLLPGVVLLVGTTLWLLRGVVYPLLNSYHHQLNVLDQQRLDQHDQIKQHQHQLHEANAHALRLQRMSQFLHHITESTQMSMDEKIEQGLEYGQSLFGMEISFVGQVREGICRVIHVLNSDTLQKNSRLVMDNRCCLKQLAQNEQGVVSPLLSACCAEMVCAQLHQFQALICAPLVVEHQSYGVLAFASMQPFQSLDSRRDEALLELLAQWVGTHLAQQQRMQALQWSNERLARFRATLDHLDDMIALADPRTLRFVDVNRGMVESTGLSLDGLLSKRLADLTTPQSQAKVNRIMNRLVVGLDRMLRFEVTLQHTNGSCIETDALVQWVELEAGKPVVVHMLRDATERKRAETALRVSEERLTFALEGSNDGLWDWNIAEDNLHCSPRLEAMLGFRRGSLTGSMARLKSMIVEQERPGVEALLRIHLDGHVDLYEAEYRINSASGRLLWILDRGKVVQRNSKGQPIRAVGTFTDITARKDMEAALHDAKVEAESASRAKSRFLANMSHEIRTPMNAILGLSSLALEQAKEARQRDFLEKINHSGHFLMGLLNDILDLSKIEAERMDLESQPFRLDELLKQLAANVLPAMRNKAVEVHFFIASGTPLALVGDALRLGQVLHNLLSNAMKFTHEGEVRITLTAEPYVQLTDHYLFTFEVKDSGIGIPAEVQPKLFESFIQADSSTTRQYGGSGLGLAICRRLMEMMHGKITLQSSLGQGSTFTCRLPLQIQSCTVTCCPMPEDAFKGQRLLVVSNSGSLPESIQFSMGSLDLQLRHTVDPEAMAALVAQGFYPDVVLLDDNCGDSTQLVNAISQFTLMMTEQKKPTILMTTVHQDSTLLERLSAAGMDGVLDKPLLPMALYDVLMRLLHTGSLNMGGLESVSSRDHAAHLAGLHVLLVEDHDLNMEVAKAILERVGIRVITAQHGGEALALLEQTEGAAFDAILMDLQMPVMDGFETTRVIRSKTAWAQPPIIALTANAFSQDRERALQVGMNDHITKPIAPGLLYAALERWIDRKDRAIGHLDLLSQAEEVVVFPPLQGWQQQQVLIRFEGDEALVRRLLDRLVEECHRLLSHVEPLLTQQAWPELLASVHGFKGITGNLGLEILQKNASIMEQGLCKERVVASQVAQHWHILAGSIRDFVGTYGQWQQQCMEGDKGHGKRDEQGKGDDILQELLELLAGRQMGARDHYKRHRRVLMAWLGESKAAALEKAMAELDFVTAEKVLLSRS
ncbi:response regulator [Magnetococcus marinus]|nr:response regulator [Magnetococcus marinus]